MEYSTDIFQFIKTEEAAYVLPVPLETDWEWGMKEHIRTSFFYKNGRLLTGNTDDKPVKNIVLYLRNLQDRAEDIDVKDIHIYVDDADTYHLSFLVKKYHDDVFIQENDLDTFFDEAKEEKNDYGGSLVKNVNQIRPEIVPLQSIAFCDQTDILSGPLGIKHFYSPDQFKEMEILGWGNKANGATATIDALIVLSRSYKVKDSQTAQQAKTPGKYIEVYEVHGNLPESFLKDDGDTEKYIPQLQIVAFYQNEKGEKQGIILFKGKEKESPFKLALRGDRIFGRALDRGGVEELFEDQVWTNYSMIRKKEMLDAASKIILKTTDATLAAKHPSGLKDLDNLELLEIEEGKDVGQLDTFPRNMTLFDRWDEELRNHAQRTAGATDPLLGESPTAGTPFRLQERVVIEGKGLHEYRKKKYARFIEEVYQDWIIPYIAKQITKGTKFLSELNSDELESIIEKIAENQANKTRNEMVLNGEIPADKETLKQQIKESWRKRGNILPIEILKDELKNAPLKVKVSVAGNKNLSFIIDKLTAIFREIVANPTILDDPRVAKIFNKIIEYSGFSLIDFGSYKTPQLQSQIPQSQMSQQKMIAQPTI